jgi:hypothetical protein
MINVGNFIRSNRPFRFVAVAILAIVAIAVSWNRASVQAPGSSDFHVFWLAGKNFSSGAELYVTAPGNRDFIYPPFAAMLFQALGVFPLRPAAFVFALVNLLLWWYAVRLTGKIAALLMRERNRRWPALAAAIVFSAVFFTDNFNCIQINGVLLVLMLLGIKAAAEEKIPAASLFFTLATFLKIVPVFLMAWLFVRRFRKSAAWLVLFTAACVALPVAQRGLSKGTGDIRSYYETFLSEFMHGAVITGYTVQNWPALVYRATQVTTDTKYIERPVLPLTKAQTKGVYETGVAVFLAAFLGATVFLTVRKSPLSVYEVLTPILLAHLLAGKTQTAHFVTFLFVFYAFLSIPIKNLSGPAGFLVRAAWAGMAVVGFSGSEIVGWKIHTMLGEYSAYVWLLLLLFGLSVAFSLRRRPDATDNQEPSLRV